MRRRVLRILRALWITAGLSATAWMYWGFQASGMAGDIMRSNGRVEIFHNEAGWVFRPRVASAPSGVIFLPGGMVDPSAYAPLLKKVAEAGYPAHLVYLPMRCACTDSQAAHVFDRVAAIVASEPRTEWVLTGHSRGGMLASRFVQERRTRVAALALIATTHPRDFDLSGLPVPVTKIYGTRDGVAAREAILQNRRLLPQNTAWIAIEGGNHVQFGYYRHQLGDNSATISREQQQQATLAALLSILRRNHPVKRL
jgi:pimeloyl-ACP methyl ester carboxylesterase